MGTETALDVALQLDGWGFNVLPANRGEKAPLLKWQQYQHQRVSDRLRQWFGGNRSFNWWVMTGRISCSVVLDIDSPQAEEYWQQRLADELAATTCSLTAKGHHYWFSIGPDDAVASWSHHDPDTGLSWDVRADGAGVIAPPSVHASGHVYRWIRDPTHMLALPDILRAPERIEGATGTGTGPARSMLAKLLAEPPTEGGRNVWLAKVAGHYAKQYREMKDAYRVQCEIANRLLPEPLPTPEFEKTIESIWRTEHEQDRGAQPSDDNGWLVPGEACLLTPVQIGKGEDAQLELAQWADFDVLALGVVEDQDAQRTYDVELKRRRDGKVFAGLLPASACADYRRLAAWLAEYGVGILTPAGKQLTRTAPGTRLLAYLEAQAPPRFEVVSALGWCGDGFITHEGVIRDDGLHGYAGRKPDPVLRHRGQWRYGFVDEHEAVEVLRQVLTFHHTTVVSVFGAWWAACLLKPQLQAVCSQFPFMALEAPSESGKTTGFFSKMVQLAGNAQGQTSYTMASLRNALSAHHSGLAWIDDEDSLDHLMQLLRMATGEGSYTKMAEDHHTSVTVQLVSPIVISGEALQMRDQKALRDRAIMLEVPAPTNRRSLIDPSRPQWDDIVALTERWPDLTVMAGNMVQLALRQARWTELEQVTRLRGQGRNRQGDKIAVLRAGARILAGMTGDSSHVDVVDAWVDDQPTADGENTLTLKILPQALMIEDWPERPESGFGDQPPTPVFVRDGYVWFSPTYLAEWWRLHRRGRIEPRTESADALEQQTKTIEGVTSKLVRLAGERANDRKLRYRRLPQQLSSQVLARSHGEGYGAGYTGTLTDRTPLDGI